MCDPDKGLSVFVRLNFALWMRRFNASLMLHPVKAGHAADEEMCLASIHARAL